MIDGRANIATTGVKLQLFFREVVAERIGKRAGNLIAQHDFTDVVAAALK